MQTFVNQNGIGALNADRGIAPWAWEACTPNLKSCEPYGSGRTVETAGAAAGTVFRVKDGGGNSWLSPEWRGPVKELAPPRVAGVIAADEYVSPIQGLWSGGWRGEDSEMQLSACGTAAGGECVSITSPHQVRSGCTGSASFYLDPRFVGLYLRVADKQSGGPHTEAGYAVYSPSGATWGFDPVWRRGRTTSAAVVGQIAPAANPPAGECGPPPAPTATISPEGVARVECAGGCSIALVGMRKGRKQLVTRRIPEQDLLRPEGALELDLPPTALARLGAGRIQLTVELDGRRAAQRTVRSSAS